MKPVFSENDICSLEQIDEAFDKKTAIKYCYMAVSFTIYAVAMIMWFGGANVRGDISDVVFGISFLCILTGLIAWLGFGVLWWIIESILSDNLIGLHGGNLRMKLVDASIQLNNNYCEYLLNKSELYPEVQDYIRRVLLVREILFADYFVCRNIEERVSYEKSRRIHEREYREACAKLHSKE